MRSLLSAAETSWRISPLAEPSPNRQLHFDVSLRSGAATYRENYSVLQFTDTPNLNHVKGY